MIDCPDCGHELRNCSCAAPDTGGVITARAVFRAACAMQRLGLPITTGAKRPKAAEREFSTGGIHVRPYTKPDSKSTGP